MKLQAERMPTTSSRHAAKQGLMIYAWFNSFLSTTIREDKSFPFFEEEKLPRKMKSISYSILQYIEEYNSKVAAHYPKTVLDRYHVMQF